MTEAKFLQLKQQIHMIHWLDAILHKGGLDKITKGLDSIQLFCRSLWESIKNRDRGITQRMASMRKRQKHASRVITPQDEKIPMDLKQRIDDRCVA